MSTPVVETGRRPGDLALCFQEAFTVAARLRANRQHAVDAASFRAHVKTLLATADRDARARGYDPEHVKLAVYAFIAFLDETVLNSSQPMFAEWARQPLQEEVFGEHMAGENFFRYLGDLLGRQDSQDLADLLEIYQLCLLLGYRGKYGTSDPTSLQPLMMSIQQKLHRIRGPAAGLHPGWRLPQNETVPTTRDPWVRRLGLVAGALLVVVLVLFIVYTFALRGQAGELAERARQLVGAG